MSSTDSLLKGQHELRVAVDPSCTHTNEQFFQNAKELYRTDDEIDIYDVFKMSKTIDDRLVDVTLNFLSEYLECNKLLVTEKGGGALGVFNSILVGSSDFLFMKRIEKNERDINGDDKKCFMFAKVLHWASLKYELYADAIY